MNFIITSDCNKGCPYCFAHSHRSKLDSSEVMTIETFKKLLSKVPNDARIKLLGGEPTQHPDFFEFLITLAERKTPFTLISNFLFEEEVQRGIVETMKHVPVSFLINSTNLKEGSKRFKKFVNNYNAIYRYLYEIDHEDAMSCGITLEHDKSWQHYVDYIDLLRSNILNIETLRISIPFPGEQKDKENFYFLNNKELGEKILIIARKAVDIGAVPSIDCIVFPCMFKNKEEYKYIKKFSHSVKSKCSGAPADIFPDETISFCYPTKETIKVDSKKYNVIPESIDDLWMRYQLLEEKYVDKLPEECQACKFRSVGMCNGPCLGFYDLTDETIGINV